MTPGDGAICVRWQRSDFLSRLYLERDHRWTCGNDSIIQRSLIYGSGFFCAASRPGTTHDQLPGHIVAVHAMTGGVYARTDPETFAVATVLLLYKCPIGNPQPRSYK